MTAIVRFLSIEAEIRGESVDAAAKVIGQALATLRLGNYSDKPLLVEQDRKLSFSNARATLKGRLITKVIE